MGFDDGQQIVECYDTITPQQYEGVRLHRAAPIKLPKVVALGRSPGQRDVLDLHFPSISPQ